MNYDKVEDWVRSNFPELEIYTDGEYVDIGDGCTVNWNHMIEHASYITIDINNKISNKIVIGNFKSEKDKTLALLHELGHYTEDQDGGVLYKEMRAWEGCFKWMRKLNITLTKRHINKASQWFSSYLDVFMFEEDVIAWLQKQGMFYTGLKVCQNVDLPTCYTPC